MILFDNGLIKLKYEPATDILFVDMPTVDTLNSAEVDCAFKIIVEHVRNYDVKKLLIDARKTEVEISDENYISMIAGFSRGLMTTRIQKVARIVSYSAVRETVIRNVYDEKDQSDHFQSFREVEPAIAWLLE